MFGKSAWGGICLSFKRPTSHFLIILFLLTSGGLTWHPRQGVFTGVTEDAGDRTQPQLWRGSWILIVNFFCLSCRTRRRCHVITFLRSGQVIRPTVNENFENLKLDRPYGAIHFHSALLSGPFSWLRKLKNAYLELLSFFMRGQLLQAPAQPRTTSLWLSLAAAKKETFQNGLVAAPKNTCMRDGIAGVCRWERSQHLNFTLELSFFILQHFLTTPITFHVQLGHDSWSWFTTWFFRGATDWKCLTFPAFARFNNSHTL